MFGSRIDYGNGSGGERRRRRGVPWGDAGASMSPSADSSPPSFEASPSGGSNVTDLLGGASGAGSGGGGGDRNSGGGGNLSDLLGGRGGEAPEPSGGSGGGGNLYDRLQAPPGNQPQAPAMPQGQDLRSVLAATSAPSPYGGGQGIAPLPGPGAPWQQPRPDWLQSQPAPQWQPRQVPPVFNGAGGAPGGNQVQELLRRLFGSMGRR